MPRHADGIWITLSELARRKGLHRTSVRERVNRLVTQGLLEVRSEGRHRLVDLVAFDRAVGQAGDGLREQGAETRREIDLDGKPSALRDAQTERAQYEARLKRLDLEERLGNLLPVKGPQGVESAMVQAGAEIARSYGLMILRMNDIETAAMKGPPQLRRVLKDIVHEQRKLAGKALTILAERGVSDEAKGPHEMEFFEPRAPE